MTIYDQRVILNDQRNQGTGQPSVQNRNVLKIIFDPRVNLNDQKGRSSNLQNVLNKNVLKIIFDPKEISNVQLQLKSDLGNVEHLSNMMITYGLRVILNDQKNQGTDQRNVRNQNVLKIIFDQKENSNAQLPPKWVLVNVEHRLNMTITCVLKVTLKGLINLNIDQGNVRNRSVLKTIFDQKVILNARLQLK